MIISSSILRYAEIIILPGMLGNGDIVVPDHQETWQDRGLAYCDQLELQPIPQTENGFLTG
jgi:hypothetical protein